MAYKDPATKKAYDALWKLSPEYKARQKVYAKKYRAKPEVAAARLAYKRMKYKTDPTYAATVKKASRDFSKRLAPEAVAEEHLVNSVKLIGGMCPKFIDPGRRGAPDRMVMLPGHPVYFVEMKKEKVGKLSSWQSRYHDDLRALGHKVWVLWSKEDVDAFLRSI
jgi:hypothetical protein